MRILHIIPTLRLRDGGPAKAILEMCEYLNRAGHETAIYTTDFDGDGGRALELNGPARDIPIRYFPVQAPRSFKFSRAFAAAVKEDIPKYDVIHINSLYMFPSSVAAHYARSFAKPYIIRPHGTLNPYIYYHHRRRKLVYEILAERRNLARAAAVHFTSTEELRLARTLGLHFNGVVVPLGVRLETTHLANARDTLQRLYPELRGKKIVLYLGRLNFKKGLDILAKGFGSLCKQRRDVHLLLAGPDDESYGSKVREWLRVEGALANVTFAGMLSGENKAAALNGADIFVLPSYSENFGHAVVEAMAAGLPVVISNQVNIWREIADAGAGRVIDCDGQALCTELMSLLDDDSARTLMAAKGRALVEERFTWEVAGRKLVAMYRNILDGGRPVAAASLQSNVSV